MRHALTAGLVAVALGIGWLLGAPSSAAPAPKDGSRPKWEYKVVGLRGNDLDADWEKALNELGADGWEAVDTPAVGVRVNAPGGGVATVPGVRVILRRPK